MIAMMTNVKDWAGANKELTIKTMKIIKRGQVESSLTRQGSEAD